MLINNREGWEIGRRSWVPSLPSRPIKNKPMKQIYHSPHVSRKRLEGSSLDLCFTTIDGKTMIDFCVVIYLDDDQLFDQVNYYMVVDNLTNWPKGFEEYLLAKYERYFHSHENITGDLRIIRGAVIEYSAYPSQVTEDQDRPGREITEFLEGVRYTLDEILTFSKSNGVKLTQLGDITKYGEGFIVLTKEGQIYITNFMIVAPDLQIFTCIISERQ